MATIDSKSLIDTLIANKGYYEDDPRVYQIVEYTNAYGNKTWGVTWCTEDVERRQRYLVESQFVQNPKIIWRIPE
jgi:hypothetical protein